MATRLTKRTIDAARASDRDRFLWDSEVRGFGVKVTPLGLKVYVLQYRVGGGHGRSRRITIGRHGSPWTPDQARREALRLLGEVATGSDPAAVREGDRKAFTLAEFADRYMADHAEVHLKPRSIEENRRNLAKHILPAFGTLRLRDITQADIRRFALERRVTPGAANRCLALLSHMFTIAAEDGLVTGPNPVRGIKRFKERKHTRFLSEAEFARLAGALDGCAAKFSYAVPAAIKLLTFTGARLNEILTLKWEFIDWDRGLILLPDSKTGEKTVYLNPPALQVLARLVQIEGNPHVLPGRFDGEPLTATGLQHAWSTIRRAAGLDGVRLHDLRHSFASFGAGGGLGLPVIGALLGHARSSTTERYSHLSDSPLRKASEQIAGRIAAAMRGDAGDPGRGADVVEIRKGVGP